MKQRPLILISMAAVCAGLLLTTGIAAGAAPARSGENAAVAAKKCKKAHKRAGAAKRCKRRKKKAIPALPIAPVTPTAPAPAPASLSISPTSHNFGTVLGDSANQTFTVMNSGGSASGTLASSLGGTDPGNFAISSDACNGTALAAGSTCTLDVHCSNAEANGVTRTATLAVAASPGGSPSATLTCFETT